ncbi:MAG: hypothetical protein ACI4I9_04705 [Porcipelethomonas sp.]
MEEYTDSMAERNDETKDEAERAEDLIELVRTKHSENCERTEKSERLSDVLVMQIIVCMLILLCIAVINFFNSDLISSAMSEFRRMTNGETEEIYRRAAEMVMKYIR